MLRSLQGQGVGEGNEKRTWKERKTRKEEKREGRSGGHPSAAVWGFSVGPRNSNSGATEFRNAKRGRGEERERNTGGGVERRTREREEKTKNERIPRTTLSDRMTLTFS